MLELHIKNDMQKKSIKNDKLREKPKISFVQYSYFHLYR